MVLYVDYSLSSVFMIESSITYQYVDCNSVFMNEFASLFTITNQSKQKLYFLQPYFILNLFKNSRYTSSRFTCDLVDLLFSKAFDKMFKLLK